MPEKRRSRRFDLRLPVEIVKIGEKQVQLRFQSRNISARGVLLEDPEGLLERGQLIEYLVHLPAVEAGLVVRVRCKGAVVRRDKARQCTAATVQRYEFERVVQRAATSGK